MERVLSKLVQPKHVIERLEADPQASRDYGGVRS